MVVPRKAKSLSRSLWYLEKGVLFDFGGPYKFITGFSSVLISAQNLKSDLMRIFIRLYQDCMKSKSKSGLYPGYITTLKGIFR